MSAPASAALDAAASAPLARAFGTWALDRLPPAPEGPITSSSQWASRNRQWIAEHAAAQHHDHARARRLAAEHPHQTRAISAEARRDALNRREPELDAAGAAFDECSRVMERAGRPLDHGRAWGVAPVVADAITRAAAVRRTLAGITAPRPRVPAARRNTLYAAAPPAPATTATATRT